MLSEIRHSIDALDPEIRALRRELHQHPEIRFEERWTSDRIAAFLSENGVPHTRGHAKGTGILAVIEGAQTHARPRTVLLRADMDALEITEATGLPYASAIPGRMHACGHDGHSACLCGVAKVLMRHRDTFTGRVRLLFQPAEEQASGGYFVVEEGLLDGVDAAFALHAWPSLPLGSVGLRPGVAMASADFFRIEIQGKGGHGANPAQAIDPIVASAHVIVALQSVVSREMGPQSPSVLTVAQVQAGSSSNVIPDGAWMAGTCRALSESDRQRLRAAIERTATDTARAFRATASIQFGAPGYGPGYPPLVNDPALCALVRQVAVENLGTDAPVDVEQPYMTAEDFAYYLQRVPGVFLFLGTGNAANGLHTPRFDFNDEALVPAMRLLSGVALRFLEHGPAPNAG